MSIGALPPERMETASTLVDRLRTPGARVLVTGEDGVGKTTVLEFALGLANREASGVRILFARGVRPVTPSAYMGLQELLDGTDHDSFDLTGGQREALAAALGDGAPDGQIASGCVMTAVYSAMRQLLASSPVAIVVDEFDAFDQESREVVRYLSTRRFPDGAVPTVIVTGGMQSHAEIAATEIITINPLSRSALGVVLQNRLGRRVSSERVGRLRERSGGNPLWAIELAARDDIASASSATVQDLFRDRIDSTDPATRELLQSVAAMGSATSAELSRVTGLSSAEVSRAVDTGFVTATDGVYSAGHAILGAAALDQLDRQDLMTLHARIATVARNPTERVQHLDKAVDDGPDPSLGAQLFDAAELARARGAPFEALTLARRAVERTAPGDAEWTARTIALAEIAFIVGDFALVLEALAPVPIDKIQTSDLDRALPLLLTAASAARGDAAARALLHASPTDQYDEVRQAVFDVYRVEAAETPDRGIQLARDALSVLRKAGDAPLTYHRALGALILAGVDAGRGIDQALLEESTSIEPRIRLLAINDSALAQQGLYSHQIGDLDASRRALETVRAQAVEAGQDVIGGVFALHLVATELHAGNRAAADRWLATWEAVDPWPGSPPPSAVIAYGLRALRDGDSIGLRDLIARPAGPGSEDHGRLARLALSGQMAGREEEWETAVADLLAARSLAESLGIFEPGRRLWLDFVLAPGLLAVGEDEEANRIVSAMETHSEGHRDLLDGVARRLRALMARKSGDSRLALEELAASIAHLRRAGFPSEQARSHLEAARLLHALRRRTAAVQALDAAAGLARSASDFQLLSVIESERSTVDSSSVDAGLTVRERAIAMSAARGATNREIAAEHHISVRTVESQLSASYRKLNVRSRSELVALLREN